MGLLNTLLVSVVGIFFATVIGFIIGIARLSSNWLIARLQRFTRNRQNVPFLLQLLFWYFAVLKNLPPPRQSLPIVAEAFNVRGFICRRLWQSRARIVVIAFLLGIAA